MAEASVVRAAAKLRRGSSTDIKGFDASGFNTEWSLVKQSFFDDVDDFVYKEVICGKLESATNGPSEVVQHDCDITCIAVSPDNKFVVSAGWDRKIIVWDCATRRPLHLIAGPGTHKGVILALSISADSRKVASGSRDKNIFVWDLYTRECLCHFPPKVTPTGVGHAGEITSVAFFNDSIRLVTGSDDRAIFLWDTAKKQPLACFQGHSLIVNGVAVCPDDKFVVSCSNDLTVRVWDASKTSPTALVHTMEGHTGAITCVKVFKKDKDTLAITGSDDRTIRVWMLGKHHEMFCLEGHKLIINALAVSHSGKYCFSVSNDETLRAWDLNARREVKCFKRQKDTAPLCVAINSDDSMLITGGSDNTLRIWKGDFATKLANYLTLSQVAQKFAK
jgi:hypothetical protein